MPDLKKLPPITSLQYAVAVCSQKDIGPCTMTLPTATAYCLLPLPLPTSAYLNFEPFESTQFTVAVRSQKDIGPCTMTLPTATAHLNFEL